jgi:DNA-binding NarL/FixJ family response regulator
MIRVLVADDNPVIVQGLRGLLALSEDIQVVATAADGREAVRRAEETAPDVVLLDVQMPLVDGVKAARNLSQRAKVLMLTYSDAEEVVVGSIRAGASGYLVHGRFDPSELADAVRDVAAGRTVLSPAVAPTVFEALRSQPDHLASDPVGGLTRREREIMNLIVKGHANRRIAELVFVSEKTVKNHVNNIYGKLGVRSRSEAIALWLGVGGPEEAR